jgi:hypothetical protein
MHHADLHMAQPNLPVSRTGHTPHAKLVRGGQAMQGDHLLLRSVVHIELGRVLASMQFCMSSFVVAKLGQYFAWFDRD